MSHYRAGELRRASASARTGLPLVLQECAMCSRERDFTQAKRRTTIYS
jgi:hypothetical protein